MDERSATLYQVAGGGHTDYSGNEVERLQLAVDAPAWSAVRTPTATVSQGSFYYADGRPCARHHYYGLQMNESDNRIMLIGGASWGTAPQVIDRLDAFDLSTGDYVLNGVSTRPSAVHEEAPAICRDPRNDDIYVVGKLNVAKWTRSTGVWSTPISNRTAPSLYKCPSAFDSTRNLICSFPGPYQGNSYTYNPSTNSFAARTITGAAISSSEGGAVYVRALDAFLIRASGAAGGTIYKVDAATNVASVFATTEGGSIPAILESGTVYNKFLYVPALRGCVYVPSYTGNVWFLRVH